MLHQKLIIAQATGHTASQKLIRYVLPVLWMTSCFHIMGRVARGAGNNDVDAVPTYSLVYNGSKWRSTGHEV